MPNTAPESKPSIHVAVAVLLNDAGWVLITRRNEKQHQGGLWEFPGGKVEPGESVATALSRELQEELAVTPTSSDPLLQIQHDYGDREVLLDVHCIRAWEGEPRGLEGQPLAWVSPTALADFDFPEANRPIAKALQANEFVATSGRSR